jgi:hypothetical protein
MAYDAFKDFEMVNGVLVPKTTTGTAQTTAVNKVPDGMGGTTNAIVQPSAFTTGSTGNLYSGLVGGKQMTLGQEDIARFDPGKITSAQVDGQLYDSSKGGIGDWGHEEWGTAGNLGLGVGQLGLGLASYFENKKTADAQRKLLGQQYASNAEAITDRRANKAALANIKIK